MALEIGERLQIAGIEIIEARINNLAYATEIAQAMLQRQQATAIVAARSKIVEGAVGMVEMALEQLSRKNIIELDEEKKRLWSAICWWCFAATGMLNPC